MSQIFKDKIPNEILYDFVTKYGVQKSNETCYVLSKTSYKKANMEKENAIEIFYNKIKKYYYNSKIFYIERKKNYKNFITIIRQICKNNKIPFSSKIYYSNSNYEIKYFIYVK